MPLIHAESVEAVRQAADLVDLLRGQVQLTRRGGRWWARCPFHDEQAPSFTLIPPDNRTYYCYGCGATGDAFTWVREREGDRSFAEAVEVMAERLGINLRYDQASPEDEAARARADRRLAVLERAASFYEAYLWEADEAEPARRYLVERGFAEPLLRSYRVGYAPGDGAALSRRALKAGFSRAELVDAGLARRDGRDFFTSRIAFPIADARGRVLGFGARTLDPGQAKYVNSPEGPSFRKRQLLFGLAQARGPAARQGWICVAEGYTDVLALAACGVPAAVACMGTSLTTEQLRQIARVAGEIRLCFDADRAGEEAAWRTVEAAAGLPVHLAVVPLPNGQDPGAMAASPNEQSELLSGVDGRNPLLTWLIARRVARAGRAAAERDLALHDITGLLRRFPDSVAKDEGVRLASSLLDLSRASEERLWESSRHDARSSTRSEPAQSPPLRTRSPQQARERRLLGLALALPAVAGRYLEGLPAEAFEEPGHRRAFDLLASGALRVEDWPQELRPLAAELRADAADAVAEGELREAAFRVQESALQRRAADLRERGDERAYLTTLDLLRRLRAASRGEA
ncbi:MAG: primase [Miltoncostaeaceae bacterium]|nr:primase [Miltoncostaeaceae bacterium]